MGQLLIHRQRAVTRIGRIRMGERRQPNRPGFQRSTWRFTSANKSAIEMLQAAYGGTVSQYEGEWELASESSQISVIVDTNLSADEEFRQQDGKTTTHRCDGINCQYIEMKRDDSRDKKKITFCEERGIVPCLCDPDGLGSELADEDRKCDLRTTLRVMIPATGDTMTWEFASGGSIFNREVFGAIDTFRMMGIHHGYCHLTIHLEEKVRGDKVSKFGVARITLDPNPPNFVAALLARTPEAQARALLGGAGLSAPALGGGAGSPAALPARETANPPTEDERRRREIEDAAMAYMRDPARKWNTAAHQTNLVAFKNACAPAGLWWPEVMVKGIDSGCHDWPTFNEFARSEVARAKATKVIEPADSYDPFKDEVNENSGTAQESGNPGTLL